MRTFSIEFGSWRGFEAEGGLFPFVRFGWVTFWCCRTSAMDHMMNLGNQIAVLQGHLADAARELKRSVRT